MRPPPRDHRVAADPNSALSSEGPIRGVHQTRPELRMEEMYSLVLTRSMDWAGRPGVARWPGAERLVPSASAISPQASSHPSLLESQRDDPAQTADNAPRSPYPQGGRVRSDWVAAFRRIRWPLCLGFRTMVADHRSPCFGNS